MGGYHTPEEAALASYSEAAGAFVERVVRDGNCAEVELDTDPSHPYLIYCMKGEDGLWYERGGHS